MTATQEKRAQQFKANSYLARFFSEKEIATENFEKTDKNGVLHLIDTEVVIAHIALAVGNEKAQIENIIRKIDFANGNINHFFGYLAEAIANQN